MGLLSCALGFSKWSKHDKDVYFTIYHIMIKLLKLWVHKIRIKKSTCEYINTSLQQTLSLSKGQKIWPIECLTLILQDQKKESTCEYTERSLQHTLFQGLKKFYLQLALPFMC